MICTNCGRAHGPGARFCGGCGRPLVARCSQCGSESPPDAQFCEGCGASLAPRPTNDGVARKVVTIVFADLVGSMSLHERLDAESVRSLMDRYYEALHAAVDAQGGTVVKLLGDGVMAAFGVPRVAEDDAIRAVRAAVDMQQAFRALAQDQTHALGLRVAVNTGEVVVSADHTDVVGDPVNVAARLQQEARDGDVLVGESTQRLVRQLVTLEPFGVFALKGRAETVAAYRVVSLERPAGVPATPFVGRDDELRRVMAVHETAVAGRRARLAVVLGSPGLGKSRLLAEVARRLGDGATILTAQCDAAGGATFAPLAGALRTFLRIDDVGDSVRAAIETLLPGDDPERARIATGVAALLAGTPASPEETFFVVRRFLAALAMAQPVVLAIDDLQWAEPLLLDLIEHLVQWSTGVPLLLLAAARPELRDARSSLATPGGLVADVVTLGGLDAGAATRLAANVVGAEELPAAIAGRVLATSEGNPLFVGELVRMLVHDGVLKREGDRWTTGVEVAALEMPPTIQALLAARIERLQPEERTVLERAAVVGRQFSRAAVAHLLPRELGAQLDARLESLRRSELIEPDTGWLLGEPVLRFHHVLIRDAAYRRILKGTRAELHARFADWLEAKAAEAVEHDETIGWHLEQAHQNLRELGPIDLHGRALGDRAARYLGAAGRRALARDDLPLASSLLGRALDRLDAADPARADLALEWCEALLAAGDVGPAAGAIAELGRFIAGSDRLRAWHTCFAGQRAALTDPQSLRATVDTVTAAADALAAAGDAAGEAKAHSVLATALARLGKIGECEAALDRALAAARRAHDHRRSNAVLAGAPLAALWGPSPVTRASGRCLDVVRVLRITQGSPAVEAVALRCQAVLEALRGRTDAARRMLASSRRMVEELGITQQLLEADVFAGLIDLLEGDAVAAERSLRGAYDGLRAHGLGIDAARAAAFLGRALLAQDRVAEAETLSHEGEALAGDDLQAALAWRGVRAEALARRGEHAAAVDVARAAVDIATATDGLLHHADARVALAAALRAAGRPTEAAAEEARAIELWESKGATLLTERARREIPRVIERTPEERAEPARPVRRRVRANAAIANAARLDAAFAAGDIDAIGALCADGIAGVHHLTGASYDRAQTLAFVRLLLQSQDLTHRLEPLATLGDSLALGRMRVSATGLAAEQLDIGAWNAEEIQLLEVDGRGHLLRFELFAADRLGDAVARLYERYAELLPHGPARERAAATARVVAIVCGPRDPDSPPTYAPDAEFVDHRLVGFGSIRGADALERGFRSQFEVGDDIAVRTDYVLGLGPDVLLMHRMLSGTARAGGGAYESPYLGLYVFGVDGLLTRTEWFDVDREDDALARFDELVAEPPASRSAIAPSRVLDTHERRVRPNAATANAARQVAAVAARDADALPALLADRSENVHHTSGRSYDRQGILASWRLLITKTKGANQTLEPLATLGDALALCRHAWSFEALTDDMEPFGATEAQEIVLMEADAKGRRTRAETFAVDRLGDAVARLYERYAELLPDGRARDRAAATARSVAAVPGPMSLDGFGSIFGPDVEFVDHRPVGLPSSRGREAYRRSLRALLEAVDDTANRVDDVLGLRPDAFLLRITNFGTERTSGGAFERPLLLLSIFDADGLVTHWEFFDPDRDAEALARFDELTAEPEGARLAGVPSRAAERLGRRVHANAATLNVDHLETAIAARDADALPALLADSVEVMDHTKGATYDRQGLLTTWRSLLRAQDPTLQHEHLATLGDSLVISRVSISASGFAGGTFDVGAYKKEEIGLTEVDAQGRWRWAEVFAADRLGDAVARLYERYAELLPDGPARERAAATARSVVAWVKPPPTIDSIGATLAPAMEFVDHRPLGFPPASGAEANLRRIRSLFETAADVAFSVDDILALRAAALLLRWTISGTDRAGGGGFETTYFLLWVFGDDGLVTRYEHFEVDHDDEALARFDELTAEPAGARFAGAPSRAAERRGRRVRANAATASAARLDAAIDARDADVFPSLLAEGYEVVDHIAGGATYDGLGSLAHWRALLRAKDLRHRHEPLATLGDSLALCRQSISASGIARGKFDVGPYEYEAIRLIEVDMRGRQARTEAFAADRLGDAIARLYECYAELLPDGPARERAAATARSVATYSGPFDPDAVATAIAPSIERIDHRPLGLASARGADAFLLWLRSIDWVAEDITIPIDDILDLRPDAVLVRRHNRGVDRATGGPFEHHYLQCALFGADGLMTRTEWFAPDREDEALARFDALVVEPPATPRITNAATRAGNRLTDAWAARDWQRITAMFSREFRLIDRRSLGHLELDREQNLESLRIRFQMGSSRYTEDLLATRGDRLDLGWSRFALADGDVGPSETESLYVREVDEHGENAATVMFDPDDLDAAYAELDRRYAAGEAAPYARAWETLQRLMRAAGAADREALALVFAPDSVTEDHRLLGGDVLLPSDEIVEGIRALVELAPDAVIRVDHILALDDRRALGVWRWVGTRDGGAFEIPSIIVALHGLDGVRRLHFYELDHLDAARACYEALGTKPATTPRIENAATRSVERFDEAWEAHDWERIAALHGLGYRDIDRRAIALLELERGPYLESLRWPFELRSHFTRELLATRGDRLALFRGMFHGAGGDIGPSEIEWLGLVQVDEHGTRVEDVEFDARDVDAAYAELDRRYAAGEGARYPYARQPWGQPVATWDWEAVAAQIAPEHVLYDHRLFGWETVHGVAGVLDIFKSMLELAPDARVRANHFTMSARRAFMVGAWVGTREGGTFEAPRIAVQEFDASGRWRRLDLYDPGQIDQARARFEAIDAGTPRDPLAAFARPNAATAARDRVQAAFEARDWAAVRAACREDATAEDRRRQALLSGDREWLVAYLQSIAEVATDAAPERRLVATFGDRIDLERETWRGGPTEGPFEVEDLIVTEVDEAGAIAAAVAFDVDNWQAAEREARTRWFARDARAAAVVGPDAEFVEAFNAHDRTRARAVLADDFVVHDQRHAGMGVIEGADAFADSLVALWDLAPDIQIEPPVRLALERHGLVRAVRSFGTLRDGGGAFERLFVTVSIVSSGRITRYEFFDIDAVAAALARFAELRPDPLRIPPNAASRAGDGLVECLERADWEALRGLCAPVVYEDRRRLIRTIGDADMLVASGKYVTSLGARMSPTLLATLGDRLSLRRLRIAARGDGVTVDAEWEALEVIEVDAEGRIVAVISFDPDDRRAASAEMLERFARSDASRSMPAQAIEFVRAVRDRDLERIRAALPDDFVGEDHRHAGLGRLDRDGYVAAMAALFELAPEMTPETLYIVAAEKHGTLSVVRTFGRLAEGGEFESVYVMLVQREGDRFVGAEGFELDDLDVARARFEALRPDPLRIPPNAATRASDRVQEAGRAQDWDALRALCAPELEYDDRRRGLRSAGDREMYLASMQHVFSGRARAARTVLATSGDRLALEHILWTGPENASTFEIEALSLCEVDAEGRIVARIVFDPDDRRGACAELFERYVRSDAGRWMSARAIELRRAVHDRDLDRIRAVLSDDVVFHDHRRTGPGRVEDADGFVAWIAALFEQSPDAIIEPLYYIATGTHGYVAVAHTFGTLIDGGAFETVFARLMLYEENRIIMEVFELEDLDVALARFEELRPDPTRIPPNAACRARARMLEANAARDWPALRALARPDFAFEDRRKRAMLTGDVELYIKSTEFVVSQPHFRVTRELLATAGDRIAIERLVWAGGPTGGEFDNDLLTLVEVDAEGRLVALINWDADDRHAALGEGYARFVAGEAAATGAELSPLLTWGRASWEPPHDWVAARSCLADDFALHDHRQLGLGTLGPDEWVASLRVMDELTPGWRWETFRIFAWNRHGSVEACRQFGTIRDGGPFETVLIRVMVIDGDRIRRNEVFAIDDVDRALARFEELCAAQISTRRDAP